MKRVALLLAVCGLAGCSNAPIAGLLDCVAPSKAPGQKMPSKPGDSGERIPPPDLGPPIGPPPGIGN